MIVEVFKTNVQTEIDTNYIIDTIHRQFPEYHINFDLEDCDRVLRVYGCSFSNDEIAEQLQLIGYVCELIVD